MEHNRMKLGALLAVMLIVCMAFVPAVSGKNDGKNESQNLSVVHIEGINDKKTDSYIQSELKIPYSIKKFDIVTLDMKLFDKIVKKDGAVPVNINGKSYVMKLNEMKFNAPGENEGIFSYKGTIVGAENSEIVLTYGNKALIARITLDDVEYIIESIGQNDNINNNRLHVVYSSEYVVADGPDVLIDSPLAESKNDSINSVIPNQEIIAKGITEVKILLVTDDQWISDEPDWNTKAQNIMAEANNQLGRDDIQVSLSVIYDTNTISVDPGSDPLGVFMDTFDISYLNNKHADIAIYLSGYDNPTGGLGSTWGYDSGTPRSRYAWAQMKDDGPSSYDGTHHDRTCVSLHEIGHMFDADHEYAPNQGTNYNRAYQWGFWLFKKQTVMWAPFTKRNQYEFSSDNYHGDSLHDNAKRIYSTRYTVSGYTS